MSLSIAGKTVVVIGASSGIGRAVAQLAAGAGARVIMVGRTEERLAAVRRTIPDDAAETMVADALDEGAINDLFARVGALDHLVVTAIADEDSLRASLVGMPTEVARRGLEKFWISFYAARAAAARLPAGGSITLTSSVSIFNPSRDGGISVMAAASGAVAVFGRHLAAELAPIRVNVVAPGVVDSGVWAHQGPSQRAETESWAQENLPVRHLGQPEELAHAILFLMTNPYTTGTVLAVDGGLSLT